MVVGLIFICVMVFGFVFLIVGKFVDKYGVKWFLVVGFVFFILLLVCF